MCSGTREHQTLKRARKCELGRPSPKGYFTDTVDRYYTCPGAFLSLYGAAKKLLMAKRRTRPQTNCKHRRADHERRTREFNGGGVFWQDRANRN